MAILFSKPPSRFKQKFKVKEPNVSLWSLSDSESHYYNQFEAVNIMIHQGGGYWFSKLAASAYNVELSVSNVHERLKPDEKAEVKLVSFVRNPYDKVVAHFLYQRRYRLATRQYPIEFEKWLEMTHTVDYDLFMHNIPFHFLTQSNILKNSEGKIELAYLGRFENFYEDVKSMNNSGILKAKVPIIKSLNTNTKDYREFYNSNTKSIVSKWYAEDLDTFKYIF